NYFFTGSALNASDRGYWKLSPASANAGVFFRPKEDDYTLNYPGGMFSGPILKNRVYFLAAYSPELTHTDRLMPYASGARGFTQPYRRHYGLGRLDFSPSSKWQLSSTWVWTPEKKTGNLPDRDPLIAAPSNDLSVQGYFRPSQTFSASS